MSNGIIRQYSPAGETLKQFHESNAFVRALKGPFGSGKSSACVMEILIRSQMQKPSPDGIRRTRWAVIRNSYPELKSTTIKTWTQWCPTSYGKLNQDSPIIHRIKTPDLDMEVLFLALDKPEDVPKLLSLELTGAWLNEAKEIPKAIIDGVTGRVGRYPAAMDGGPTWSGVIMDTNPPDDQSWYYHFAEKQTPEGWLFLSQPSGLSPKAENLKNLPPNYYKRLIAGKDPDWVKVYVEGQYGYVMEGKPVFPMYLDSTHASPTILEPDPNVSLFIGVDFGVSSAAVIGQKLPNGTWLILDEFVSEDASGIQQFSELLVSYIARNYPNHTVGGSWADPAGNARTLEGSTPLAIIKAFTGWPWKPAPTNDIDMRLEVVAYALRRLVQGKPGLIISPKASLLRKGFTGGYHYKLKNDGTQTFETPNKNKFSHPHDALQYMLLGGGEREVVLNRVEKQKRRGPRFARDVDYLIFDK